MLESELVNPQSFLIVDISMFYKASQPWNCTEDVPPLLRRVL
jgi:hypothetical protein